MPPHTSYILHFALSTENVTEIKTNIFVTSFGPVSDTEMVSSYAANTINTQEEIDSAGQTHMPKAISVFRFKHISGTTATAFPGKNAHVLVGKDFWLLAN